MVIDYSKIKDLLITNTDNAIVPNSIQVRRVKGAYGIFISDQKILVTLNRELVFFIKNTLKNYQSYIINTGKH